MALSSRAPLSHNRPTAAESPEALLHAALQLVETDMDAVNRAIQQRLRSDIALIKTLSRYLIDSGGKRLRPLIVLLSARACDCRNQQPIILAAVLEFIHTATLLHDDVVDASMLRRGQPTANQVWGNQASVLVGDFLYSRAFEMMLETNNLDVMRILATTTNAIAEGEVIQLLNSHSPDTDEATYLDTIRRKTAKLFESAARLGAVVSQQPPPIDHALAQYGLHLGNAFQLIDDLMDYVADRAQTGKNPGNDLAEGKPTLPLIYAMQNARPQQANLIRHAIANGDTTHLEAVLDIVESSGALAYTTKQAERESAHAIEALAALDASPFKQALIDLAQFAVRRSR